VTKDAKENDASELVASNSRRRKITEDAAFKEVDAIDSPKSIGRRLIFSKWSRDIDNKGIGATLMTIRAIPN
jgi:hypothetical protein